MDPVIAGSGFMGGLTFALSIFNVVVPFWLGVTVLASAEERRWGVWLAGLSLLAAGTFFIFHTAMVYGALYHLLYDIRIPEYIGWIPLTLLPLAWYGGMLWFSGFFENNERPGWKFHRWIIGILLVTLLGIVVLLAINYSGRYINSPQYSSLDGEYNTDISSFHTVDWFLFFGLYLLFLFICYFSTLFALSNIQPTGRISGDVARRRARPWLVAATSTQVGIVVLVGLAFYTLLKSSTESLLLSDYFYTLRGYDLAVLILVTGSLILLGEAIVRYEIFTGVVIPRRGFRKRWRGVLIMGGILGLGASIALQLKIPGIYGVLGSIVGLAVLYALFTRRYSRERDQYLDDLRSFLHLAKESSGKSERKIGSEAVHSFHLLCRDVLNTRGGWILLLRSEVPLLAFPDDTSPPLKDLLPLQLTPETLAITLPSTEAIEGEYIVTGLWSRGTLSGWLVLDEKEDRGLYTREELELARAACENVVEIVEREEMADRLARLQGERLSENRVNEIRVRRLLHDEVLPQIHAALLSLNGTADRAEAISSLGEVHRSISDLLRDFPVSIVDLIERSGFVHAFQRLFQTEFKDVFANLHWEVKESVDAPLRLLSPLATETLFQAGREAVRNAARYAGGEDRSRRVDLWMTIHVVDSEGRVEMVIEDNGVGFHSSTRSVGSGQGLKLHQAMMEMVGGSMNVEMTERGGTCVQLQLPAEI
ncbi:MAG: sensor histidine kinase [Candidatus Kapaibacterium sp.]